MCTGGGGFFPPPMMGMNMPMNAMPMIPAIPKKKRNPPPCSQDDGNAKITAELAAPFLEELNKLGDCKQISAEVNGQRYNIKLECPKKKKKKRSSSSSSSEDPGKSRAGAAGPSVKLCDCNLPVPPGLCDQSPSDNKAFEREERMNKNLSLCMQMMRELFAKNFDRMQEEDENAVQMVEIPVMVVPPGGMPGMGGGMPGMGGGMPGMGMMGGGMPGMGMMGGGMPGMGMMGGGMPGMGMMGGGGGMPSMGGMPKKPCEPCSKDKARIVCKTDRDQQCDESGMGAKDEGKQSGGKKSGGKKKGKK